jgi:hypothetical protein
MQQPAFRWPTTPVMLTLLSQVSKDRFRECDSIFLQKLREEYQHQYDPDWAPTLIELFVNIHKTICLQTQSSVFDIAYCDSSTLIFSILQV